MEPARLAAAGKGLVHHVIRDEEVGLKLHETNPHRSENGRMAGEVEERTHELDAPAEGGGFEIFIVGKRSAFDDSNGVDNGETTV